MRVFAILACASFALAASADVEWTFPRTSSCHEGIAFADGVTGVLVWGGGEEIRLTVGRADLWDHRGGYPWLASQSYTNVLAIARRGDMDGLRGLFQKVTPAGEPRNPYMLPLGRVIVRVAGCELKTGALDPKTGIGRLDFVRNADGRAFSADLAMGRESRAFAMRFPEGVGFAVDTMPATAHEGFYASALAPLRFERAVKRADGFDWRLPADPSVSLDFAKDARELVVSTRRGDAKKMAPGAADYAHIAAESRSQWGTFWADGARVSVPDAVLQRVYDYGMYRFGAMTDPKGVPAGLQGPWLEDDKLVPWNGDYHFNINVQECYSPAYRGGHFEHLKPLFDMILSWRPRLRENARMFVGIDDGYVLPHSVDDRGVCIGGFWTGTIDHASAAWMASMMFRYVRYSRDLTFLRDGGAYDFMRGAMKVYRAMMSDDGTALAIPLAPSPEWNGDDPRRGVGRNPSFQLAAAHRLAQDLIDAAAFLGDKPDPMWADVRRRLPLYSKAMVKFGDSIGIFEGQGLTESHRHHSHLAGLYPFDIVPLDDAIVPNTYRSWALMGTGWWTGWCVPWASILRCHAGDAAAAVQFLHDWDAYFCNKGHGSHHNSVERGFTVFENGITVMQMDGQCAAATAVMELLAHEVNGRTEFFRGCPETWREVSFENLRLSDGRRVSGSRVNGRVTLKYDGDLKK